MNVANSRRSHLEVTVHAGRAGLAGALSRCGWDHMMAESQEPDALQGAAPLLIPNPLRSGVPTVVWVSRDGEPAAAAALVSRRRRGLVEIAQLAADAHRFAPGVLWSDPASLDALVNGILAIRGDILRLREVPAGSPIVEAFMRLRPGTRVTAAEMGHFVDLTQPRPVPRRVRVELRRSARRAAERGPEPQVAVITDAHEVDRIVPAMCALAGVERSSTRLDPHVGTPEGRAHLAALWRALAAEGRLAVTTVTVGAGPVAFAAVGVLGGVARGHVMAFDRTRDVASLGWMALVGMVDHLSLRRVHLFDLGSGGDEHKRRIARPRATVDLRVPMSPLGRAALAVADAGRSLRR